MNRFLFVLFVRIELSLVLFVAVTVAEEMSKRFRTRIEQSQSAVPDFFVGRDTFEEHEYSNNGQQHQGRGTAPIPNQSNIQITVDASYDRNLRGVSKESCLETTWIGPIENLDEIFWIAEGVSLWRVVDEYDEYTGHGYGGAPWVKVFHTVANLKKGLQIAFVGICGNPGKAYAKPSLETEGGPNLAICHIGGTKDITNNGPEVIPCGFHVFGVEYPSVTKENDGTFISKTRYVNMTESSRRRLEPMTLPLNSNKLAVMLGSILKTIEKLVNVFRDKSTREHIPNWEALFREKDPAMRYLPAFLHWGIIMGSFRMYEVAHNLILKGGLGITSETYQETYYTCINALKTYWDHYLESACNISVGYNVSQTQLNKQLPREYSKKWHFSMNKSIDDYLSISQWKNQTSELLSEEQRRFFATRYMGLAMTSGGPQTKFELLIRAAIAH